MEANTELKYIFSNVNDWLKFAEAKHAGLIVINSGLVLGVLASYSDIKLFVSMPAVLIGGTFFGISFLLSIISQFPVTKNIFYFKNKINSPNIYFFGHLSKIEEKHFIEEFKKGDINFNPTKFDNDLINQILVNSRIANTKFLLFKFSSYTTSIGVALIVSTSLLKIICHY